MAKGNTWKLIEQLAKTLNQTIKDIARRWGGWLICIPLIGYFISQSELTGGNDFSNSYFGAKFLLQGEFDLKIFDPYSFNKKIYDDGYQNLFVNYNPNPPSASIFFIPLALLPLDASKILFNIVSSIVFLWSLYRLCKHVNVNPNIIILWIPFIFFIPIRNQILFGQTYFLIFALMVEGFIANEKGKISLAAVLWTVAIFIKVFPVIILLFVILKKDWKQLVQLGFLCGATLLVLVLVQGIDVWKTYLLFVLPRSNQGEIQAAYLTTHQSALMFFKYLFIGEETLNPHPLINSPMLFKTFLILFKVAVLTLGSIIMLQQKNILSFAIVLFCGMLISPYGSTYSNILLVTLLIALQKEKNTFIIGTGAFIIFLIGNLPVSVFQDLPLLFRFPRFILMCMLIAFVFWATNAKMNAKILLFYLLALGVPVFFQPKIIPDTSKQLLSDSKHILIFDYGVQDSFIFYTYWQGGPEINFTTVPAHSLKTDEITIQNNQIFYRGKQLTHSRDNKIRASILNNNSIIYLSDKGKGIGFYTIRIMPLNN